MKNLFKNLMLVAVAAMGFTACEQVGVESVTPVAPEVEMTVIAGMDDTRTYIDEANGMVQWSADDQLKVIENSATYRNTTTTTIGTDGKAKFAVSFPENTSDAEFTYNAVFPASAVVEDDADKVNSAKVKVEIKNQQNATATSFDPQADVLVSKQLVFNDQPKELNMQFKRLVALGKMTLTNLPVDAKIESVVFTAGAEDVLAGRNYVDATTGEVSQYGYYGSKNALTINYAEEAIATRDIYFTCNPFEMEAGETFKVKVVCGNKSYTREVEIPAGRSLTFTEGNLGTFSVDMKNATVETISAFAEGDYVVLAYSNDKYYAMTSTSPNANYRGYKEVEYDGEAAFATIDETLKWTIEAVDGGYTMKEVKGQYIYLGSNNNYAQLSDTATTLKITLQDDNTTYKINIVGNEERYLGFNKNSGQERFAFYKNTQVHNLYLIPIAEDTTPRFEVGPETLEFDADATAIGDDYFTVTSVNGFDITKVTATTEADWFVIDDSEAADGTWYMCPETNDDVERTADVVFSAEGLSVTVKVKQQAAEGAVVDTNITVAEFLENKDKATEYTLTGKITRVANTTYGNFDLTDATGTIYVYGLLTPDGTKQTQWAEAGLKEGDIITIKGKYNEYNGSPQVQDATYVSHKAVAVDKTALEFAAEGSSQEITVTLVNATDAIIATVDNSHFTVTLKSGTIYTVTAPANETEKPIAANLTFTAGELTATVALTQAAPTVEGEVPGGRDDFNTVAANTSYITRTTTAGWKGTNCAVLQGGTGNSPTFSFIGANNSTRAFTINGKTTAKGTITSPTLTTGCGKLSLNYGIAFSESNGVDFTVTIKQNGTAVKTYKIDVNSITQKKAYTWEQEVNVAGDFVIEITNNCPSNNSSSNKDRVSIWDIEWTGYNN